MSIEDVKNIVIERVDLLEKLIEKHAGTEHEYALLAGKFELLRLMMQIVQQPHS